MMAPPIVTLTTDFGLRDPFVGIMKGVILGICPSARLVDLTHEVAPRDVLAAALALESAVPFFPGGAIHLAVVDPGVGSSRRALGIRAGGQYFVGPDNGLFTFVFAGGDWAAVALEAGDFRLPSVSRTFHGRDVFAPAAAHLAAGVCLDRLGPVVSDPARLAWPECRVVGDDLVGEVIGSDRFGNLLTSVTAEWLGLLGAAPSVSVSVGGRELGALRSRYAEGGEDRPAPILGSTGRIEIFVRNGSARALLGAERGTAVRVRRRSDSGAVR
jgi:S-adenosylmethionine hydrolase